MASDEPEPQANPAACGCSAPASTFTPAVEELVAVAASVAANCEPCLRPHLRAAERLGISAADLAAAVRLAEQIKATPARKISQLAAALGRSPENPKAPGCCPGP